MGMSMGVGMTMAGRIWHLSRLSRYAKQAGKGESESGDCLVRVGTRVMPAMGDWGLGWG